MEDDDEFGDLYTDVLTPFAPSSSAPPPPPPPQSASTAPPFNLNRPTDLNAQSSDDEEILFGASNSVKSDDFNSSRNNNQLTLGLDAGKRNEPVAASSSDFGRDLNLEGEKSEGLTEVGKSLDVSGGFLESGGEVKVEARGFEDPNFVDESKIDISVDERDDKGDVLVDKDEDLVNTTENLDNFDVEEVNIGIGDVVSEEHMIPGLSIPGVSDPAGNRAVGADFLMRGEGSDDWDSDSEDDLQIVLNDNHHGPMAMDRIGGTGADDDDEDEDGEPLVIVGDSDPNHQAMEEQDWGEDASQGPDGERKELGDAAKVNGGVAQQPKIPYNSHVYHPFHSQFKYVRPGAAPMPGAAPVAPGGVPGQPRPPVNIGPIAGRGRGDWRPTGMKNAFPMQKSFQPGFGNPGWANNGSGRGFGSGLEFTLPSHKTIFEVDIDNFEEKPWKLPGIEISDFFNFGLNEETWKDYCKQLEQLRLEATMQSRIRVYESGRTEQEYDPDMPPELAAAAGIHDVSSENANIAKADAGGQSDLVKDSRMRPQLPTGRAIQVETGYGERLPSIDTRPPRIRDSDAIIEIVLQDSADDDPTPVTDTTERPDNNDPSRTNLSGGPEIEEDAAQDTEELFDNNMPQAYNDRKREFLGRRPPFKNSSIHGNLPEGDQISPFLSEVPPQYRPDSRGQNSVYPHEERRTKVRTGDRSPNVGPSTQDKRFLDIQKEDSVESVDAKHHPRLSSPRTVKTTATPRHFEDKDSMRDEVGLADGRSPGVEREETAFDMNTTTDSIKDENRRRFLKKQKLGSHVEQSSLDDGEDSKAARSSENSKARSGSSKDYRNLRDGSAEEVVQDGRSSRPDRIIKRPSVEDEHSGRSKARDERQEVQRHRVAPKGREDPYYRKSRDPNLAHHSHMKSESIVRRKEDNSDLAWQRKDEDPHGRRARAEETGSRHRSKARENERSEKDEHHQSRKQLDNGSYKGYHDKDTTGSRLVDRDDSAKIRNDNMDDLHSRKRKEEALRRDHVEKEEILHVHRENTSRRKRERDDVIDHLPSTKKDILDQRKRDEQARARSDDQRPVRHKEDGWFQRERVVDRQRERDESLYKREREEVRGSSRSGRPAEEKEWVGHSRVKDEYKGFDREYHFKETGRHSDQIKRRDRVESESASRHRGNEDVYAHGNQISNDERRLRQERESSRSERAVNASDNHRVHEKKHKENPRKSKESEGGYNSSTASRRNQEDHHGSERARIRGTVNEPKKHKEDASSDEEQQDSRRGRSKLERWTSHKERDFTLANTKSSSSSLNVKEIDGYKTTGPSLSKVPEESLKTAEPVLGPNGKMDGDPEIKSADEKPAEDNNRHLDTVAKLKKRSERFKLPMPSEKEALAIKKMENEPLPSSQTETRVDSEVKHERPPRKRRWTSS